MSKIDKPNPVVNITFHGDGDVAQAIQTNPDLHRATWEICSAYTDAYIRVDVASRLTDSTPVEWTIRASSPKGRQTAVLTQRKPNGHVSITAE